MVGPLSAAGRLNYPCDIFVKYAEYKNEDALNKKQLALAQKIISESFENPLSRDCNFVYENPGEVGKAFVPGLDGNPFLCTFIGSHLWLGGLISFSTLATSILLTWYGTVTIQKLANIKKSPFYQHWIFFRNKIVKNKAIEDFIMATPEISLFVCPLSGKLPEIAVKEKGSNKVYDFDSFEKWIKEKPEKIALQSKKPYTLDDIEFDFAHMLSIMDRLFNLMEKVREIEPEIIHNPLQAIDFFFDKFGQVNHTYGELREICFKYLSDNDASQWNQNDGKILLNYLSAIVKSNLEQIKNEKEKLLQKYQEEVPNCLSWPSKQMIEVGQLLLENPRKIVVTPEAPNLVRLFYPSSTDPILKTIDTGDPRRRLGLKEYPNKPEDLDDLNAIDSVESKHDDE